MKVELETITLQRFRYAETSQIVHLLTPDLGRVVVLARGSFREKNSYHGPLDLLVKGRCTVSLVEGRELGVLLHRRVSTAYGGLRRSMPRYACARHMLHLVESTTPVGTGDAELFRLFDRGLQAAQTLEGDRLRMLLLSFDLRLLRLLGLEPEWSRCVRCGREGGAAYVASTGGAVCASCRAPGEGMPLSGAVRRLLEDLSRLRLQDVPAARSEAITRAEALLGSHLGYHLEAAPPAWIPPPARRRRSSSPSPSNPRSTAGP